MFERFRSGLQHIISQRLSYVILHDLSPLLMSQNNKNKTETNLLFPKLTKLFQYLWNFCIYNVCNTVCIFSTYSISFPTISNHFEITLQSLETHKPLTQPTNTTFIDITRSRISSRQFKTN